MKPSGALPWIDRRAASLAGLAVLCLGFGLLVYQTDRDAARTLLVPVVPALQGMGPIGVAAHWLPSLLHAAAFGLLTAALLPARGVAPWLAGMGWGLVDALAEGLQHPAWREPLLRALHELAPTGDGSWLGVGTTALAAYARHGRFDPQDVLAAFAGGLLATATALACRRRPDRRPRDDARPTPR